MGNEKIFIGYFATGGIGSHPGIVTEFELEKLEDSYSFWETQILEEIPEALLCIFDGNMGWDIRGISNELSQEIINTGGSDFYYEGEEGFEKSCELAGIKGESPVQVAVIKDVTLNTIYYSHNPEVSHGYWEPKTENLSLLTVEEFCSGNY